MLSIDLKEKESSNLLIRCVFWSLFGDCCHWELGKNALQNTEEDHKQETDLKPSIITTRALRETQSFHAEVFSLSFRTSLKAALRLGIMHQLHHLYGFSPMTVSHADRAVFWCCTTTGVRLTSVLPGDFNSRTFHQNSSNTGKESDQFRMEFMDIVHLSVPWSALSTVTRCQQVLT